MANHFQGRGNLGAAPTLRHTDDASGQAVAVAHLRIYFDRPKPTNDGFTDRGGFWANVSFWGRRAEVAARVLPKGARVAVEGELLQSTWQDRETGQPRSQLEIRAGHVDLDLARVESLQLRSSSQRTTEAADTDGADVTHDASSSVE
ncbi:single-stranded DNA-binding protein [Aquisalimonas lutea]|uniref:single-stranded DNA-binding protein n=1 Tax=Aquisalimonas lutea TaxID=1327750 RepID=UPI0025B4D77B|nr:single-stranded DNA-binding protein [Aquisalimonas lutea]MDN3518999.1 single-stranded DNA-binding protein [Aquisalimonas lutea]